MNFQSEHSDSIVNNMWNKNDPDIFRSTLDVESAAHNECLDYFNRIEESGNLGSVWESLGRPDEGDFGTLVDSIVFACVGKVMDRVLYDFMSKLHANGY